MKKVLILTPNWPPVSCPDLHRVRMALPYFKQFGWKPLILKIDPNEQEGIKDAMLCCTVPEGTRTWQAGCLPLRLTRWIGLRNVGLRSITHLARLGDRIIREEKPDAVFFSTTMFPLMTLGRYWRARQGVPYVLDFQDPWRVNGLYARRAGAKRRLANAAAGVLEPFALRRTAHVVSVSPAYVISLRARYPWLQTDQFTVLPFGAAEMDYESLRSKPVRQNEFDARDGKSHWVYVGRGGADMSRALAALFSSLRRTLELRPALRSQLRLHFIGTAYAPKGRAIETVAPLAAEAGLSDVVHEKTDRIPYFEALQCLLDAHALIVPGSDDPGYTASKIYPYILARKPLLAVFHEQSSVVKIIQSIHSGTVVSFSSGDTCETIAEKITASRWLEQHPIPETVWSLFEPYTAREMTRRLCEVLDQSAHLADKK